MPRDPLAQPTIRFAVTGKNEVRAKIGMSMLAEFTMPAGDGRVDRHTLTVFRDTCKLMSQHQRVLELRVADGAFREPVQVRAADSHRFDAHQFFSWTCHRDGL